MQETNVGEHKHCLELTSGEFRVAVTTEVGPRVIGGFIGGSDNIFQVLPIEPMADVDTGFILYGGHRLWHAPEVAPRTYAPDNDPVEVAELDGGAARLTCFEPMNGIEKRLEIRPLGGERFELTHTLKNRNQWVIELAPWALSVMAGGGMAIIPQLHDPNADPFQADRRFNFWPYADLGDPRLSFGSDFVVLRQDPAAEAPLKIGCNCPAGWIAYVNGPTAFVEHVKYDAAAVYPDFGSNIQSYSCGQFLEIETTGPLARLGPEAEAVHIEVWQGLSGVGPVNTEDKIKTNLVPRLVK